MAIGNTYAYHGVETGVTDTLTMLTLEHTTFSHETGVTSHTEVKRAEKDLAWTANGRDGWIVTFYQVSGDNTLSESSTIANFNAAAVAAIKAKYSSEVIGA